MRVGVVVVCGVVVCGVVVCGVVACGGAVLAAQEKKAAPAKKSASAPAAAPGDAAVIKTAMAAGPASISRNATIMAMDANMKARTVRKGTNDWTCMVAGPDALLADAMCADQNAMAWFDAYMNKKDPPKDKVGFVYMLAGDHGASNTDPYAEKETPANNWVKTGPHVMVLGAKGMTAGYPRDPKADPTKPYVMWPGTPYEHLMLPVK